MIHEKDRYNALKRLLDFYPEIYGMIFCRTRIETQQVAEKLIKDGYPSASLHGDLSQAQRDQVMRSFREKNVTILVATDVAARGIDVDSVTHVIHYNLPDDNESYTHRSGRTGRAGKTGISMALVNTREKGKIFGIERQTGLKLQMGQIPDGAAICEKQLYAMIEKMVNVTVNESEIEPFMSQVFAQLSAMSKEELIKRFVSIEFNRFLEYYRHAKPIESVSDRGKRDRRDSNFDDRRDRSERRERSDRGERRDHSGVGERRGPRPVGPEAGMVPFIVEGVSPSLRKGALVRILCDSAKISSEHIGQIALVKGNAIIDVKDDIAGNVHRISEIKLDGKNLRIREFVRDNRSSGEDSSDRSPRPERRERKEYRGGRDRSERGKKDGVRTHEKRRRRD
jgi:ATP-dependent RNA helicase DeaD